MGRVLRDLKEFYKNTNVRFNEKGLKRLARTVGYKVQEAKNVKKPKRLKKKVIKKVTIYK